MCACVCTHVCVCLYLCAWVCARACVCLCARVCARVCVCVKDTSVRECVRDCECMRTCEHVCVFVCACKQAVLSKPFVLTCVTDYVPHMKWVMSLIWMSHVLYIRWFVSHVFVYVQKAQHIHPECLTMGHVWMSHDPHMNESCQIYEWVVPHIFIWERLAM